MGEHGQMRQLLPGPATDIDERGLLALYADAPLSHVRGGFVVSVDGAAVLDGGSRALSGPADRLVLRVLRAVCDVILVGAGTTKAENYGRIGLTQEGASWRADHAQPALPRVAVVSRSLDIDERVLSGPRPIVVTCAAADTSRLDGRVDLLVAGDHEVDLAQALDALAGLGLPRALCEGGPSLLGSVAAAGRLDELCLTTSPVLAGPAQGMLPSCLGQPLGLRLRHLLEEDGALFSRYTTVPI